MNVRDENRKQILSCDALDLSVVYATVYVTDPRVARVLRADVHGVPMAWAPWALGRLSSADHKLDSWLGSPPQGFEANHRGTASKQAAFFSFSRASTFQQQLRPPSRVSNS